MTFLRDENNKNWLESVNSLLKEKAIEWADDDLEARDIQNLENPSEADKQRYIDLIQAEFPELEQAIFEPKIPQSPLKAFRGQQQIVVLKRQA